MDNENNSNLGSRSENRDKKRKANRIYNILLTIVIVAIIAVAIPIFTGDEDDTSNTANDKISENKTAENEKSNTETDSTQEDATEEKTDEDAADQSKDEESTEEKKIVENSGDSNVSETYVNDGWEPVGTTQTGDHVTNYSTDSVDWKEMTKALAYGAGLSADNMTVWYIGNGGATNKAVGTVSAKDNETTYRVYIEWVDGQGWQPTKVEQLKQNDKR